MSKSSLYIKEKKYTHTILLTQGTIIMLLTHYNITFLLYNFFIYFLLLPLIFSFNVHFIGCTLYSVHMHTTRSTDSVFAINS